MEAMDDTSVEIVPENDYGFPDLSTPSADRGCTDVMPKQVDNIANSSDASYFSNEIHSSTENVPKLPILKKIGDLTNKIQILRKDHIALTNEVKDISTTSFPGAEIFNALHDLNAEREHLKKKQIEEYEHLKQKYLNEFTERKRLYNEVVELKGNIRVFCRCRPLNHDEIANGSTSVVEIVPSHDNDLHITCADSSKKQFKFDHVFGPRDGQEAVFAQTCPVVTSVLDGFNVCIFAYGQTGTGKTFTMEGTPENRGVNYRTLEELFRIADLRSPPMRYELLVSMLEVYNEKIRDLLAENSTQPTKKLEIKQAAERTQEVPGLVETQVNNTDEVWQLLKTGSQVRSVGSTNANESSSRSHCLLRVTVKSENLVNGEKTKSHLWLVDLAGSERVGRIEVEGEMLKESQFINKSLSALGDVISALAGKTAHVPYRNSKLTHLLQSSLGGDCKTVMLVQISPSAADLGETLCSLNFASRVRGIESGPARKQVDVSKLLKYKQMADKLKHDEKEVKKLQDNVQSLQLRLGAREHICRSLQEKVRDLENKLAEERKLRQRMESKAVAAVSAKPAAAIPAPRHSLKTMPEKKKKPPLGPSKPRMPLRRISNFMPQPSPAASAASLKTTHFSSVFPRSVEEDKENVSGTVTSSGSKTKAFMRPRRVSRSGSTADSRQPRRRVSMATLLPGRSSTLVGAPWNAQEQRSSLLREPTKVVRRCSNLFSILPESSRPVESTPIGRKLSSKFMGSPPSQQIGSWRPKHPTVVALQKKPVVWSPLKYKGLKNHRKSSIFP